MKIKHQAPKVAVAGHICLDIIPTFHSINRDFKDILVPGKLIDVGPASMATGGSVSNTGIALHRLGIPTRMIGKIGNDQFGSMVLGLLNDQDPLLTRGMIIDSSGSTSYSIVISPPDRDRIFLHCPGVNDTFCNADIKGEHINEIGLFHFGYPPLMRKIFRHDARELEELFQRVRKKGIFTSLDMAKPDPESEAGIANWPRILERVLPHVDMFMPSLDEILFMINRKTFDSLIGQYDEAHLAEQIDTQVLDQLADTLISMGARAVAIKLGDQGLYLRTGGRVERLANAAGSGADNTPWRNRQLLTPCFRTRVAGTTGAGDCTIAGFIAGLLSGMDPVAVITNAVGVGACCTEATDATGGIPDWHTVINRINSGWQRLDPKIDMPGWQWDEGKAVWKGPRDMVQSQFD
jgi:sugar/nucleoside kinase (ribokinase family)